MKQIFKRMLALALAVFMAASFAACGGSGSADTAPADNTAEEAPAAAQTVESETAAEETAAEPAAADPSAPVYGGSLTMYYHEFYNLYAPEIPISYGYAMWMEGLWAVSRECMGGRITYKDMVGQIAESWEPAADFSSLTVKLRDDVCFQTKDDPQYDIYGGRNVTADDVKYTYDRLLGIGSGWTEPVECEMNWTNEFSMLDSVESDGALTVTFHFNTKSEVSMSNFMTTIINICGPEWDELTPDQQSDWHYANGTGPFILTNVNGTSSMTYTKNENYYQYDENYPENKLPYLDTVTLIHMDDTSDRMAQFIAGSVDWLGATSAVLGASEIAQLVASMPAGSYTEYTYPSAGPSSIQLKNNQSPFDNKQVRIAMQKAINVPEVMSAYYHENAEGDLIPGIWAMDLTDFSAVPEWSDELRDEYTYDPEGAKELLAEAGYPNGFEFTITLPPIADTNLYILAATYLSNVGITMNIETTADILETISVSTNRDNPNAVSGTHGGKYDFPIIMMTTLATGANYGYFAEDTEEYAEYAEAVNNFASAEMLDEQSESAKKMDLIFAEAHWDVALAGVSSLHEFMSGRVHGYDGQRLVNNQVRRSLVARMWVDGE